MRVDLGLSAEDAWDLTPRLAVQMLERKAEIRRDAVRTQRVLFGEVVAAIYNVKRDTKKRPEPYTWRDIFPDATGPAEKETQTDEQMLMSMHMWTALFKAREKAGVSN